MKTYVLIISETFPQTHLRKGEGTEFVKGIESGCKIHTIRNNTDLWIKRVDEIQKGNAVLSVRIWTGKPYRSKQKEIFSFGKDDGVGLQIIEKSNDYLCRVFNYPPKKHFAKISYTKIADNDGLTRGDFDEWFKNWDYSHQLALIHFTPFRYQFVPTLRTHA